MYTFFLLFTPGPPGKNVQTAPYLCIRTHSCVTKYFLLPGPRGDPGIPGKQGKNIRRIS